MAPFCGPFGDQWTTGHLLPFKDLGQKGWKRLFSSVCDCFHRRQPPWLCNIFVQIPPFVVVRQFRVTWIFLSAVIDPLRRLSVLPLPSAHARWPAKPRAGILSDAVLNPAVSGQFPRFLKSFSFRLTEGPRHRRSKVLLGQQRRPIMSTPVHAPAEHSFLSLATWSQLVLVLLLGEKQYIILGNPLG